MPCYHPLIRIEDLHRAVKAKDGHLYHPAKIISADNEYFAPEFISKDGILENGKIKEKYTLIPCGKCIGCRLEYSRQWANRGYLENKMWEHNYFVTFTYDEAHLPQKEERIVTSDGFIYEPTYEWQNGTLVPEDMTHILKTIRKNYEKLTGKWGIRFLGCGEYGEEGQRPHMHFIIFNMELPEGDLYSPQLINKKFHFKSHFLEWCWTKKGETEPRGFVDVTDVSWNDIAYVARYVTKKINGPISEHHYAERGQEKEFFRASRMPGIGAPYFYEHYKEIYENDEIIVQNNKGAVKMRPPRFFDKLYEQMDPDRYEEIKKNRKEEAFNLAKVKDETTSLLRLEQLAIEEHMQEESSLMLRRNMENKI